MKAILFALLVAFPAGAAELSDLAVKTLSRGQREARTFKGSGLLFRRDGKTYVVTSDHVMLHGDEGYSHRITSPTYGEHKVKLLVAEWAMGLALLEVAALSPSPDFPELGQLWSALPDKGDSVTLVGYPLNSDQPIEDSRGKVVDPRFESPLFYSVPQLIQVLEAHGEFGMSGGPLFSSAGKFLGLLSHQIVKQGPRPENKLLILPAAAVHTWLSTYFKDPAGYRSAFYMPPTMQFDMSESVAVGDIAFTEYRDGSIETSWLGGSQSGAKLPDPSGILERIRDFSKRNQGNGSGVAFDCFRKRGKVGGRCLSISYRSIAELFRLIALDHIEPVTHTGINFREDIVEQLRKVCKRLEIYQRQAPQLQVLLDNCDGQNYPYVKPIDIFPMILEAQKENKPFEQLLRELLAIWRKLSV